MNLNASNAFPASHDQPDWLLEAEQPVEKPEHAMSMEGFCKQENEKSMEWTISWEEALRRENKYRRKTKSFLQRPDDSDTQTVKSVELMPDTSINGTKRKASFVDPQHQDHARTNDQPSSSQKLRYEMPQQHSLQNQRLSLHPQWNPQPPCPEKQLHIPKSPSHQQPFKGTPQVQWPVPGQILGQQPPSNPNQNSWCKLCEVQCMNPDNLRQHFKGKKHISQLKAAMQGKRTAEGDSEVVWCKECNIPCVNKFSLTQHLLGKKHLANIGKLAMRRSGSISSSGDDEKSVQVPKAKDFPATENFKMMSMKASSTIVMSPECQWFKPEARRSNWK